MSLKKRLTLTLAPILVWAVLPSSASAYNIAEAEVLCSGDYIHLPRHTCSSECAVDNYSMYRLCNNTWSTDDAAAIDWAFWMWERESRLTAEWYRNTSTCSNNNATTWWDNGNELSEVKMYSQLNNMLGEAWRDTTNCVGCWGCHDHIIATDIKLLRQTIVAQDTLSDCLSPNCSSEQTMQHEIGHAYGLDHFGAWASTMVESGCYHTCNRADSFHHQPMADDTKAVSKLYGRNVSAYYNLSGMHFDRNSDGTYTTKFNEVNHCGNTVTVNFTYFNHYAALTNFPARVVLVAGRNTTNPSGNIVWTGSTTTWSGSHSGATYSVSLSLQPSRSTLTAGSEYRVWIQVDPSGTYSETDEGDNYIPTNTVLTGRTFSQCPA